MRNAKAIWGWALHAYTVTNMKAIVCYHIHEDRSRLYERLALIRDKNDVMQLANEGIVPQKPQDILYTPYVLEFAGLEDKASQIRIS